MNKTLSILMGLLVIASMELNASCTKEQKTKLIMNDVSEDEIAKLCGADSAAAGNTIIINNNNNNNNNNNAGNNPYANNPYDVKSGIEIRVGTVFGSGTGSAYRDDIVISEDVDTEMSGMKFQLGMTTERNNMYSYIYVGYQSTNEKYGTGTEKEATLFLFGAESASGGEKLKFVFGGEFGFGSQVLNDTTDFGVFTAEPFIGLRVDFTEALSLNAKIGYRAKVMSADLDDGYGSTANLQIFDFGLISGVNVGFKF